MKQPMIIKMFMGVCFDITKEKLMPPCQFPGCLTRDSCLQQAFLNELGRFFH